MKEARDLLVEKHGIPTDYLRLRALPLCQEVLDFIDDQDRVYVIEMNRDGQLYQIISVDLPNCDTPLISLTHNDGMPLTATWIKNSILSQEDK
jgi:2-oxoglutarate ferredoxin oxidoreductase subunit alpha